MNGISACTWKWRERSVFPPNTESWSGEHAAETEHRRCAAREINIPTIVGYSRDMISQRMKRQMWFPNGCVVLLFLIVPSCCSFIFFLFLTDHCLPYRLLWDLGSREYIAAETDHVPLRHIGALCGLLCTGRDRWCMCACICECWNPWKRVRTHTNRWDSCLMDVANSFFFLFFFLRQRQVRQEGTLSKAQRGIW